MEDTRFSAWLPFILLGAGAIALLLTCILNINPTPIAEPLFRTLAIVQGALFAIVFSIIILGVRLSANRYSPRVAELYRSDAAYLWTFVVFGVSIGANLLGLYVLSSSDILLRFFVVLGGVLAVVAFWTLYQFVSYILQQTTPEGILQRIDDHLSPDHIIEQAERAAAELVEPNPFLILVSVINSAIEDGDDTTAEIGLEIAGRRTSDVLEHASEDSFEEDAPLTVAVEELCTNRLIGVAHNALANNLPEVARETLDSFQTIVSSAAENGADYITRHALRGLFEITGTVNFDIRADRVRSAAIKAGANALQSVLENERWAVLSEGIKLMGWRVAQSIQNRGEDAPRDTRYGTLFIRWVPTLLEEVVERLDVEVRDDDMDWSVGDLIGEDEVSNEEAVFHGFFLAMAEMTSALIRYQVRTGTQLVRWQYISRGWSKCFETTPEAFTSLRRTWLSTMLYIDYLFRNLSEHRPYLFQAEIRRSVPREFVNETIDRILEGRLEARGQIDLIPGRMDPTEVPGLTGVNSPPNVETDREFEEWLEIQREIGSGSGGFVSPDNELLDEDSDESPE